MVNLFLYNFSVYGGIVISIRNIDFIFLESIGDSGVVEEGNNRCER